MTYPIGSSAASNPQPFNWKLTLCYDGSAFFGWQVQPGRRTVQGALAEAIRRVTGEQTLPQGSGRTDAGVHALGQVASVKLHCPIPRENVARALNNILPSDIRILAVADAPAGFHARHSAIRKTYEYRLWRTSPCPPWKAPYVWAFDFRLDLDRMRHAAAGVLGTHDFQSFQATQPDHTTRSAVQPETSSLRTLFASEWEQRSPELLVYRVTGSGFLHHMVRNLVGTFLAVGRGQIDPESIPEIIERRSRSAAGSTAPASGLWLHSVEYPPAEAATGPMLR